MKELKKWLSCRKCRLWKTRRKVVLGRGVHPADVLLVGLAPGKSEDLVGDPFVGEAGRILDSALRWVRKRIGHKLSIYITNLVGCRPCVDNVKTSGNRDPEKDEIIACWPRVQKTISLVQPRAIVLLGKVSQGSLLKYYPDAISLSHPAYILRRGGENSSEFRSFVRGLTEVFKGLKVKKKTLFESGRSEQ